MVVANKKAPVSPLFRERSLSNVSACRGQRSLARGDGQRAPAADVPLLDRPAGEEGPGDAQDTQDDLLEGTAGEWGEEKRKGDVRFGRSCSMSCRRIERRGLRGGRAGSCCITSKQDQLYLCTTLNSSGIKEARLRTPDGDEEAGRPRKLLRLEQSFDVVRSVVRRPAQDRHLVSFR